MFFEKCKQNPAEERANEKLRADNARLQAQVEFLAIMAGIELPGEEGDAQNEQERTEGQG